MPNFAGVETSTVTIMPENQHLLVTGYEARTPKVTCELGITAWGGQLYLYGRLLHVQYWFNCSREKFQDFQVHVQRAFKLHKRALSVGIAVSLF